MKVLSAFFLLLCFLYGGETIGRKWESSANCLPCHTDITKKWKLSRHANSHFSKNDLFRKTLLYIVKKRPTNILSEIKIKCAKCHNPRSTISSVSNDDKLSLLIGYSSVKNEYSKALNNKNMLDGINCVVCHNVDRVHLDILTGSQGYKSVSFGKQGTMFGPFDDAVSPYHKTEQRSFFSKDSPTLCFACHYSAKNHQGIEVYATGKEYESVQNYLGQNGEGCKKCHMSERRKGIASNYSKIGEKPKERMVRKHRFASVDNSNILSAYIDIFNTIEDHQFIITLKNNTPHSLPTGYGLREILLTVRFFNDHDKEIQSKTFTLGQKWQDKRGKATIPHLAHAIAKDTRLPPKETKVYRFVVPKNTRYLIYTAYYKLINSQLAKEIGIEDKFFLKSYIFSKERVNL